MQFTLNGLFVFRNELTIMAGRVAITKIITMTMIPTIPKARKQISEAASLNAISGDNYVLSGTQYLACR